MVYALTCLIKSTVTSVGLNNDLTGAKGNSEVSFSSDSLGGGEEWPLYPVYGLECDFPDLLVIFDDGFMLR